MTRASDEHDTLLWSLDEIDTLPNPEPVQGYPGRTNFDWRITDAGAHQLVTWSAKESRIVFNDLTLEASIAVQLMARPQTPASTPSSSNSNGVEVVAAAAAVGARKAAPATASASPASGGNDGRGGGRNSSAGIGRPPASVAVAIPSAAASASASTSAAQSTRVAEGVVGTSTRTLTGASISIRSSSVGSGGLLGSSYNSVGSSGSNNSNDTNGGMFGLGSRRGRQQQHGQGQGSPPLPSTPSPHSLKPSPLSSTPNTPFTMVSPPPPLQLAGIGGLPSAVAGRPQTLAQEFRNARGRSFQGIYSIDFDEANRTCELDIRIGSVAAGGLKTPPRNSSAQQGGSGDGIRMQLRITFPSLYPISAPPSFHFANGGGGKPQSKLQNRVKVDLCNLADDLVAENKSCLQPCVELLVETLEAELAGDRGFVTVPRNTAQQYNGSMLMLARTSGACFSGNGQLVCFSNPSSVVAAFKSRAAPKIEPPKSDTGKAPKSVSKRSGQSSDTGGSLARMFFRRNRRATSDVAADGNKGQSKTGGGGGGSGGGGGGGGTDAGAAGPAASGHDGDDGSGGGSSGGTDSRRGSGSSDVGVGVGAAALAAKTASALITAVTVLVHDISIHLPMHPELSVIRCHKGTQSNTSAACLRIKEVAARIPDRLDLVQAWSITARATDTRLHSGGGTFARKSQLGCYGTVAIPWSLHPFGGVMLKQMIKHYVKLRDAQTVAMLAQVLLTHARHQSESGSCAGKRLDELLAPEEARQYTVCMGIYADALYRSGRVIESAEMRKASSEMNSFTLAGTNPVADAEDTALSVASRCNVCGDIGADSSGPEGQCKRCPSYRLECSICRTHVKSRAVFCIMCGHGGHSTCIQQWSLVSSVCPTGCGCRCSELA